MKQEEKEDMTDWLIAREECVEEYKNNYLQQPITFLTEENLNKLETHCNRVMHYERGIEHKVVLELLQKHKEHLAEREADKKKIKELEEENRLQRGQIMSAYDRGWIPKQKVKDLIENETINISGFECIAVEDLEELLEDK